MQLPQPKGVAGKFRMGKNLRSREYTNYELQRTYRLAAGCFALRCRSALFAITIMALIISLRKDN